MLFFSFLDELHIRHDVQKNRARASLADPAKPQTAFAVWFGYYWSRSRTTHTAK
jgi:hypothetical protein